MKTIYLVKKHPEVQGHQDNWITMNSYEFAMFMKTEEGKKRRQYFGEDNMTGEEYAKKLGLSRKTIHWKKEIILKKLRSFLE